MGDRRSICLKKFQFPCFSAQMLSSGRNVLSPAHHLPIRDGSRLGSSMRLDIIIIMMFDLRFSQRKGKDASLTRRFITPLFQLCFDRFANVLASNISKNRKQRMIIGNEFFR